MIVFLVVVSLALSGGLGAPTTAVYKFVKCNPEGDQANCITHQSTNMEWNPDLPSKLPASAAQYLEAEPEEDERDAEEEYPEDYEYPVEEEENPEEEEYPEEEEEEEEYKSPEVYISEGGSGDEGSGFMVDLTMAENGSGERMDIQTKGGRIIYKQNWGDILDEQKPAKEEMKEDHLLHL
ncbi:unnamed protein product [Knipowitschia caucasica]